MAKTRAMRRASLSRRRSYRRRVKSSACRGKGPAVCRSMDNCKYSSGRKRSYCRKAKNTRRHRRGGSRRGGSRRGGSKHHRRSHKRRHRRGRKAGNPQWAVPATLFGLNELVKKKQLKKLKM